MAVVAKLYTLVAVAKLNALVVVAKLYALAVVAKLYTLVVVAKLDTLVVVAKLYALVLVVARVPLKSVKNPAVVLLISTARHIYHSAFSSLYMSLWISLKCRK
jgi:hypothetical protein